MFASWPHEFGRKKNNKSNSSTAAHGAHIYPLTFCTIVRKCDHQIFLFHNDHWHYVTNVLNNFRQSSFNHVAKMLTQKIARFYQILVHLPMFSKCHHQHAYASSSLLHFTAKGPIFQPCQLNTVTWQIKSLNLVKLCIFRHYIHKHFQKFNCGLTPTQGWHVTK